MIIYRIYYHKIIVLVSEKDDFLRQERKHLVSSYDKKFNRLLMHLEQASIGPLLAKCVCLGFYLRSDYILLLKKLRYTSIYTFISFKFWHFCLAPIRVLGDFKGLQNFLMI